jgi:hypothetical protein
MLYRASIGTVALLMAAAAATTVARAWDDAQYPDWKGEWFRASPVQWDSTRRPGRGQQAPLTPQYQAIYEVRLAEQEKLGGQDYNPQVRCLPPGMPRAMIGYEPLEIIVTPDVTYMRLQYMQAGPGPWSRHSRDIRSGGGSTKTGTAATTARSRNPRLSRSARGREHRHSARRRQPNHHQVADFPRPIKGRTH